MGNNTLSPLSDSGFFGLQCTVVMLLAVVFPVIAANTVLLVALFLESSTVKVVCLVLGSILVSCLLAALGLAMYHISGIILNLSSANKPPEVPCTITLFLSRFRGAAIPHALNADRYSSNVQIGYIQCSCACNYYRRGMQ